MNRGQYKDPLCYLTLAGTVVGSLSLTQEVAGLNSNLVYKNLVSEFIELSNSFPEMNFLNSQISVNYGKIQKVASVGNVPNTR